MTSNICKLNINKKCQYKAVKSKSIGGGNYGEVFMVEKDDKKFAFKILRKEDEYTGKKIPRNINNPIELDILFRINSPYLNKGESIIEIGECDKNYLGLVVNILNRDLFDSLIDKEIEYKQKKKIMKDVALCLKCMHDNNYIHLDIKPENMMFKKENDDDVTGVLIDYGLSSYNPSKTPFFSQHPRITHGYEPPSALEEYKDKKTKSFYYGKYSSASDIWSLGISFGEIITNGRKMIDTRKEISKDVLNKLFNEDAISDTLDKRVFKYVKFEDEREKLLLKDLLINMLMIKDNERYTIEQVINHSYWLASSVPIFSLDYCRSFIPENIDLSKSFVQDLHYLGVYEIVDYCKKELSNYPLEIFFMAIDIYLRTISKCSPEEKINYKKVKNLAIASCLIAYKFFNWSEEYEDFIEVYGKITLNEEVQIYKALEGIIKADRYFEAAETFEDLTNIYNELLFHTEDNIKIFEDEGYKYMINKNIMNYLNIKDVKQFIFSVRKKEFKPVNKYELKMKDFFEY
jgi:serine/threonine protein kinase